MRLGYPQTGWLALLPAIERVLKFFLPLKSYFQSQNKCPLFLLNIYENPLSEVWLYFVQSGFIFPWSRGKVEGQRVPVFEVILIALMGWKLPFCSDLKTVSFLHLLGQSLENWKQGELPQGEVQKFHVTALSFNKTTPSYFKKWNE
jgi:hypothetical protein